MYQSLNITELTIVSGSLTKTNHINGIHNFCNQAKRHTHKFNGIPRESFHLFLKECEWLFNNSDPKEQLKQLNQ